MTPANRWYLLKTAALMMFIKLAIRIVPFKRLYAALIRLPQAPRKKQPGPGDLNRALQAIDIAGRHTPLASTCLIQALTAQVLLARDGIQTEFQIGVVHGNAGQLEAHAWLVHQGKVVVGDRHDLARYQVFANLQENLG